MIEEAELSETSVLKQLKISISKFIERIGQEVEQLNQRVEAIQREIQSSQAKTDIQIVELSSRLSNLENTLEGLDSRPEISKALDVIPDRKATITATPIAATRLAAATSPSPPVDRPGHVTSEQVTSLTSRPSDVTSPAPESEKKEEKRELLKALQLIDSL